MLQETSTAGQGMQLFSDTLQIYSQPLQVPFPVINIKISNQYIEESSWYLKKKKKHLFAQLEIYKMQICQASDFFFSYW